MIGVWNSGQKWNQPGLTWGPAKAPKTESKPMPNNTKMPSKKILAADKAAVAACKEITTYAPKKDDFKQTALDAAEADVITKETTHTQKKADLDGARNDLVAAYWTRHELVLGMRAEVKTQFGDSSNEVEAVGLKPKNKYKKGGRRKTAPAVAKAA